MNTLTAHPRKLRHCAAKREGSSSRSTKVLMKRSAMHCNVSCLVISVIKVAYSLLFTVSLAKPFVLAITPSST
ncbi:Uncharacterised protein [Vibrio cholerae]|nr:Uncharacterised protein [Vibrio cholerae]